MSNIQKLSLRDEAYKNTVKMTPLIQVEKKKKSLYSFFVLIFSYVISHKQQLFS